MSSPISSYLKKLIFLKMMSCRAVFLLFIEINSYSIYDKTGAVWTKFLKQT